MSFLKTPQGAFFQQGQNGLTAVTDPSIIHDLANGQTPYTTGQPFGPQTPAPQNPSPYSPMPSPLSGIVSGNQSLSTPNATADDPYTKFNTALMGMLKQAQGAGNNSALYASRDQLNNQSLNLSNPLNSTPYQSLFKAQNPEQSLSAQQGTQAAFQPGITSINSQIQAGNDSMGKFSDLFSKAYEIGKPVSIPYGGSLYLPASGQTVGGMSQGGQDLVSTAIREGRLDSTLLTKYGLPSIVSTLQQDPNFDFNTGHTAYERGIQSSTQMTFNPITGEPIVYQNKPQIGTSPSRTAVGGQPTQSIPSGGNSSPVFSGGGNNSTQTSDYQSSIPLAKTKQQADFINDFNSGTLGKAKNALNTAIGHLFEADQAFNNLHNGSFQLANSGKNALSSLFGSSAATNYETAQTLASNELASAYGGDTQSDRQKLSQFGGSQQSPEQHQGYMQTATSLLASKLAAIAQQYRGAMNAYPPSLDILISPANQVQLAHIGVSLDNLVPGVPVSKSTSNLLTHSATGGQVQASTNSGAGLNQNSQSILQKYGIQ